MPYRQELVAELTSATGHDDPMEMCNDGGPDVNVAAVGIALKYLASSVDSHESSVLLGVLRRSPASFDGRVLTEYFERNAFNRWKTAETIRASKAKVPCEWLERALTNEAFGDGRQMLCEAIAKKCPKPFARRVLLSVLDQLPGHVPDGLGISGEPEDIPRLAALATTVPMSWQRKEIEKAIRKICRRHGLPNPFEPPASKR